MKYIVGMFGCGLIVSLLLSFCAVSEAQEMPAPAGGAHVHNAASTPGQAPHASQKRPCTGQKRQDIPRPERNRFEETGYSGGAARPRKSGRAQASSRKRPASGISDDQRVSSVSGKTRKTGTKGGRLKVAVTSERIDDIPVLLAAMTKMALQPIIDRHIPVQRHQRA